MWFNTLNSLWKKYIARWKNLDLPYDRRRLDRIQVTLTIKGTSIDRDESYRLTTENINTGGFKFASSKRLVDGDLICMEIILLTHYKNVSAMGRVVWCEKRILNEKTFYEGGMEFVSLEKDEKNRLEWFIRKYRIESIAATPPSN